MATRAVDATARPPGAWTRTWRALGPGIVTGAADDDPSGITTYSLAGAMFGTSLLWTAALLWPLMVAVQTMCARVGMVTGAGITAALRERLPRWALALLAVSLLLANVFNIGADLAGMGDAAESLTRLDSRAWVVAFGAAIAVATVELRYAALARIMTALTLVLLCYVAAAVVLHPDWHAVARAALLPVPRGDRAWWGMLVAVAGTTLSPYLFFWQASQEVEVEKAQGRVTRLARIGASSAELSRRQLDIGVGAFGSNVAMFFIILTAALTLHGAGGTMPRTSADVARALRPVAGAYATMLFTVGIIGTGVLAIPTLAGSAAYALAELFGWPQGMDTRWPRARRFYSVIAAAIGAGALLDLGGVDPVRALYWSAVVNGMLAPVLLVALLRVASDRQVMRGQPSSRLGRGMVWLTAALMAGAAVAMLVL